MNKICILMLFGGESSEHDVSIASARNVYAALDATKYETILCYIQRDGTWSLVESIDQLDGNHPTINPVLGGASFVADDRRITPDVLLPVLHGTNGEDGSVQGLAQLMHLPIVGCDIIGSAICMDKDVAKRLLAHGGIAVAESLTYRAGEPMPTFADVVAKFGLPLFIKPADQGSSVGVHKVTQESEFTPAITDALQYTHKILIEKAIVGREIECAVLGNNKPEASPVGEIKPGEAFYSYDDKYAVDSHAEVVAPADLPAEIAEKVRGIALRAYKVLECRGMARVDFFVTEDGKIYVNELNTLPGFTNISMYPKLWDVAGLQYPALIDRLIALALEGAHANN